MSAMVRGATDVKNWVRPPSKFSFLSDSRAHLDVLNELSFLSVAFRPVGNEPFFLKTSGVNGEAITQWETAAPFGFISKPKLSLDKITIRFVTEGAIVRRNSDNAYLGRPGTAMFVAFDEMVTEEASAGFNAFAGTIDRSALLAGHVALEGTDELPFPRFQPVVTITTAQMRAFRHNFQLIYLRRQVQAEGADLNAALVEEMMIYQFLATWPKVTGEGGDAVDLRPSWQVRRAMDYIEANLQNRITLAEIAAAAQTGVRSLQASFRKELGRTPIQWIQERRLTRVRKDLLSLSAEEASVSAVARRWGFSHMGDFSRRYRELFGETATQTRRGR